MPLSPLVLVAVIAAGLLFVGRALDLPDLVFYAKPVPVVVMAILLARTRPDRLGRLVALGLLASGLGDVLLELSDGFVAGIAAFAAAHLLYIGAMLSEPAGRRLALARQIPFVLWVGAMLAYVAPRVGALGGPFIAYGVIIGVMMGRSVARLSRPPRLDEGLMAAGAVLFGASDSLIALSRAGVPVPAEGTLIIALYWAGQALIAWGAAGGRSGR